MNIVIEALDLPLTLWGEGALWHQNRLLFVDIKGHKVHRVDPENPQSLETWEIGGEVGFVVPRAHHPELLVGSERGLHFLNPETGELQDITHPEADLPDNRFNDGKCDPQGRLFAGTISRTKVTGSATLYRLDPDLSLHTAFSEVTNSNGIVWSADGLTCWYIDTPRREVLAFDHDPATGSLSHPRRAIDTSAIDASPDGMTIDAEDKVWIAFCHGGCVVRFDPRSGETLQRIDIPAIETTSVAFGGPALDQLFVTTGIASPEEGQGGKLFRVSGLGIRGAPSQTFAG